MAVLIKDMEMPESCDKCVLLQRCSWCECSVDWCPFKTEDDGLDDKCDYSFAAEKAEGRRPWCPLIEIPKQKTDDKLLEEAGFEL